MALGEAAEHLLAGHIGGRLAPAGARRRRFDGLPAEFALQLAGIDGMIQIQKMLQGMASVTKVAIGKLEGDKVTFNLLLQGDKAELVRGLQLESRLHQIEDNESGLRYQWSQP